MLGVACVGKRGGKKSGRGVENGKGKRKRGREREWAEIRVTKGLKLWLHLLWRYIMSRHQKCSRGEPIKIHARITRHRVTRISSIRQMRWYAEVVRIDIRGKKGYVRRRTATRASITLCATFVSKLYKTDKVFVAFSTRQPLNPVSLRRDYNGGLVRSPFNIARP